MSLSDEYKKIYDMHIRTNFMEEIALYDQEEDVHFFRPLSHNCPAKCSGMCSHDCYKSLGWLMRRNMVFYCYGEAEVVKNFNNGIFCDLEKAVKLAYKRTPDRAPKMDGLPGEVLLDAIVQSLNPDAYKMAVRTLFRQKKDKKEIKGYDLTYFTNDNGHITLWLGQAKMGNKQYCRNGILHDLAEKYSDMYMADQIYFLADKPVGLTDEGAELAEMLNRINVLNIDKSDRQRADQLLDFLEKEKIDICIPCLMVYEKKEVYRDIAKLTNKITSEKVWCKKHFAKYFKFSKINPKLLFIIFPIEDIDKLRGDKGFYYGLR